MRTTYTKERNPSSTIDGFSDDYGKAGGGALPPPASRLEHYSDIVLADVLAAHTRLKHDPEYRRKNMPESALTPAQRRELARRRRAESEAAGAEVREWERRFPIGCDLDGLAFDDRFKVLRLYLPANNKPSFYRTTRFAERSWPDCRQVVVVADDVGDVVNYRRTGPGEWVSQQPGERHGRFHYIYG